MTQAAQLAQYGSNNVGLSFKNRIINGDMTISQRGTSFTNVGSGSPPTYTLDRWVGFRGGYAANLDVSQQAGFSGFQNCLRMQRTSGTSSTQIMTMNQVIETNNCFDLAGQSATLSVTIRAGANYSGGAVAIGIQTSTINNDTSANLANGNFTAGSFTANPTITTTGTTYTATGSVPANARTIAIQISWTPTGTAGANDFIEITGCQLEKGSVATSFDYLPFGTELMLCQRYYTTGMALFVGNWGKPSTSMFEARRLPVTMRASGTVTFTVGAGTWTGTNAWTGGNNGVTSTAENIQYAWICDSGSSAVVDNVRVSAEL
jgi:hypothetical protein